MKSRAQQRPRLSLSFFEKKPQGQSTLGQPASDPSRCVPGDIPSRALRSGRSIASGRIFPDAFTVGPFWFFSRRQGEP